jgi:hypothetical protein
MDEQQRAFVRETIAACRSEVDDRLDEIERVIATHQITPEIAEQIAMQAAVKAEAIITNRVKMEIADGAIGIIKRAAQVVAIFLVGLMFWVSSKKWPWQP